MSYSKVKYTYTSGGSTTFSYSNVDVLGAGADPVSEQLDVYLNDALLVLTLDYTINTGAETITLTSRVTSGMVTGDVVVIQRTTKLNDRYVDWTNNAGIDETDLDLEGDQHLFIEQELSDELGRTLKKNVSETYWEGQSLPSNNCAPATTGSGWVTLDQVNNLINGGDTATLGTVNDWCFNGDGTTDDFLLTGSASNTTVENLMVSINGVTLCPCGTTRINTDVAGAKASGLIESTSAGVTGTRSYHISQFNTFASGRESALAGTDYKVSLEYYAHTISGSMPGGVPANGSTFRGTKAQMLAWLATWSDNVTNMVVSYDADVVGIDTGYTWNQATRTLSITPPPAVNDDICVRQLTGTVAVDLLDLSLDGSELADDSIGLRHIDMVGDTYYQAAEGSGTANTWPANSDKILVINADGSPYLGLINTSFIADFTTAVTGFRLNQFTTPNASVNMNTQKITNLQAGSSSGDAVNFTQLSTTNSNVTTIQNRLKYDAGVAPDVFFNNWNNNRSLSSGDQYDPYSAVGCRLEQAQGDSNILFKGFRPRFIVIRLHGALNEIGTANAIDRTTYCEWQYMLPNEDNNFTTASTPYTPYTTEFFDGTIRRIYQLPAPRNLIDTNGNFGFPDNTTNACWLICEEGGQKRVWLRIKRASNGTYAQLNAYNSATGTGSISVFATKGL